MWKKILKLLLFLVIFFGIERFCYYQTAGFRLAKISSDFPFNEEWEVDAGDTPYAFLDQSFTFLGSGVQCYVFLGEDNTTVLKVFKHYHALASNETLKKLPLPHFLEKNRQEILNHRFKRIDDIFKSCKIAFEELKEETGLLYLHLNKTTTIQKQIDLIDKIGNHHQINLDTTPFLLQKKGELFFVKLTSLLENHDDEEAGKLIHLLVKQITSRASKGIINDDPLFYRNFAYLDGNIVEIDTGSFFKNPRLLYNSQELDQEVSFEIDELRNWVKKNCPQLIPFLHQEIDATISS